MLFSSNEQFTQRLTIHEFLVAKIFKPKDKKSEVDLLVRVLGALLVLSMATPVLEREYVIEYEQVQVHDQSDYEGHSQLDTPSASRTPSHTTSHSNCNY